MRVGFDIGKAIAAGDGVGRFAEQLLHALDSAEGEHELVLVDLGGTVTEQALRDRFPNLSNRCSWGGHTTRRLPVDVFYATTWRWPTGVGAPVLFALYDVTFLSRPQHHTPANRANCLEGTLRALVEDATFVTLSQAAAREIEHWLGPSPERLRVVPLAAAADFTAPDSAHAAGRVRAAFDLEPGYVLAVGTLEPRKNHRRLLAAHRRLPAALRHRAPLVLAGGRGWRSEGLTEAQDLRWLGRVDDDQLVDLYSAAGVVAYPSLEEGFGLPVLEAMACGTPVVTSNVSSLPEVAGDAALLVDPIDEQALANALTRVLDDADLAADLAARGLRRAASFSWQRVAAETLAICSELVETRDREPPGTATEERDDR